MGRSARELAGTARMSGSANTGSGRARAVARHVLLDGLSVRRHLLGRDTQALARPRVHFPYLHAVPRHEELAFRAFVEALAERHTFITYDEAVHRVLHGPIDRPYVALSFDDGFVSNVRVAKILEEYGVRGCFFVPTGFIGSTLTPSKASVLYGFSSGIEERAMTWGEVEQIKDGGHAVENHSVNHPVISAISEQQAVDEIYGAAETLRTRLGECKHFAWPRGRFSHFTASAARAVFASGHLSCASAERGSHTTVHEGDIETLCLRRDHEMTDWPLRHAMYFVARSSDRAAADGSDGWPAAWKPQL